MSKTKRSNPSNEWNTIVMSLNPALAQKHSGSVDAIFARDTRGITRAACQLSEARGAVDPPNRPAPVRRAPCSRDNILLRARGWPALQSRPTPTSQLPSEPSTNCRVNIETRRKTGTRGAREHALLYIRVLLYFHGI